MASHSGHTSSAPIIPDRKVERSKAMGGSISNLFDACAPRADVLQGTIRESDCAADLSQVLRGDAPAEYRDPALFFANTYPTKGPGRRAADRPASHGRR